MKTFKLLILLTLLFLPACQNRPTSKWPTNECINSFETFAYTIPDPDAPLEEEVLPLGPWEVIASLPDLHNIPAGEKKYSLKLTRTLGDNVEIWISNIDEKSITDMEAEHYHMLVFNLDANTWTKVSAEADYPGVYVGNMFLDNSGGLWGQNYWDIYHFEGEQTVDLPILSKFNIESQRFELVRDSSAIPAVSKGEGRYNAHWSKVVLDESGVFWIFPKDQTIYSYDPKTNKIRQYLDVPVVTMDNIVMAPSGDIYFDTIGKKSGGGGYSIREIGKELYRFNTETGEATKIELPGRLWPAYSNFLVDANERIWLDAVGWMSPDGKWNRIYPNPLNYFWKNKLKEMYRYYPDSQIIFESSDGRLWFARGEQDSRGWGGMGWFDPKDKTGCWFTTGQSEIYEDQLQNMWILIDQHLYRSSVNP